MNNNMTVRFVSRSGRNSNHTLHNVTSIWSRTREERKEYCYMIAGRAEVFVMDSKVWRIML